jgi:hypothetical protein
MFRIAVLVLALGAATSAQAMPSVPSQQTETMAIQIRQACGAGMHRINGRCVTTPARRQVRRGVVRNR